MGWLYEGECGMLNCKFSVCLLPSFHFALSLQACIREAQAEVIQTHIYNLFKKTVQPNGNYLVQNTSEGMFKPDRQCVCKSNFEVLSRNHFYRRKTISIKYSECMSVA